MKKAVFFGLILLSLSCQLDPPPNKLYNIRFVVTGRRETRDDEDNTKTMLTLRTFECDTTYEFEIHQGQNTRFIGDTVYYEWIDKSHFSDGIWNCLRTKYGNKTKAEFK